MKVDFKGLEKTIEGYLSDVEDLRIPGIFDANGYTQVGTGAPHLNSLTLNRINRDLPLILKELENQKEKETKAKLRARLLLLERLVNEKIFVNDVLIQSWADRFVSTENNKGSDNSTEEEKIDKITEEDEEDNLAALRKRLMSGGKHTLLDASENQLEQIEKSNTYHESLQEDIISEISGIASSLKESAFKLSSKILEDTKILNDTSGNLMKNEALMKSVGNNLNDYVTNKTGGKITIWFLLKILAASILLFLIMSLLIRIFPKM